jgi:hypothetical protein
VSMYDQEKTIVCSIMSGLSVWIIENHHFVSIEILRLHGGGLALEAANVK